jgi:hypothetical protein
VVQGSAEVVTPQPEVQRLLSVAVALSARGVTTATAVGRRAESVAGPVVDLLLHPPLVPRQLHAGRMLDDLAHEGRVRRDELRLRLTAALDVAVPAVVAQGLSRVDLAGIVRDVLGDLDLPEIIRESTGSMASESLRGLRMQGIEGDDAIARGLKRLLGRR